MNVYQLIFWLAVGHAIADTALQPDRISRMKPRSSPEGANGRWAFALASHGLIHGGVVALITGSVVLGMLEMIAHIAIDFGNGEGCFQLAVDQLLHAICKLVWAIAAIMWLGVVA